MGPFSPVQIVLGVPQEVLALDMMCMDEGTILPSNEVSHGSLLSFGLGTSSMAMQFQEKDRDTQ